jgi:hypothetical protein
VHGGGRLRHSRRRQPPPDSALGEGSINRGWAIQQVQSPGPGYNSVLASVSCTAGTPCMSVGCDYLNQSPRNTPSAALWKGTT